MYESGWGSDRDGETQRQQRQWRWRWRWRWKMWKLGRVLRCCASRNCARRSTVGTEGGCHPSASPPLGRRGVVRRGGGVTRQPGRERRATGATCGKGQGKVRRGRAQ